jgi:hypothetical protein
VEVVDYTIDLLQCFLAQYRQDVGLEAQADSAVWARLASAAGHALAGLLHAHNTYYHDRGAAALIEEIALFCLGPHVPQELAPLREPGATNLCAAGPQEPEIVAALLTLWEQGQRRQKEWLEQHHGRRRTERPEGTEEPATAEQEPAPDHDPGWDF